MYLWGQLVDVLREAIFAYAQACHGNVGYGIVAVTFLARLALLPLMLRIARASAAHQAAMARLEPELATLKARNKDNPRKLHADMQRVLAREGISMFPMAGCLGNLAPVPVLIALYSAVQQAAKVGGRFLWIENIALPNLLLAIIAAALGAGAAGMGLQSATHNKALAVVLPAAITVLALWKMAAGVGIYWAVTSLSGIAQGLLSRRQMQTQV